MRRKVTCGGGGGGGSHGSGLPGGSHAGSHAAACSSWRIGGGGRREPKQRGRRGGAAKLQAAGALRTRQRGFCMPVRPVSGRIGAAHLHLRGARLGRGARAAGARRRVWSDAAGAGGRQVRGGRRRDLGNGPAATWPPCVPAPPRGQRDRVAHTSSFSAHAGEQQMLQLHIACGRPAGQGKGRVRWPPLLSPGRGLATG